MIRVCPHIARNEPGIAEVQGLAALLPIEKLKMP